MLDECRPAWRRFQACCELFMVWSTLRFDDTLGLVPHKSEVLSNSLRAGLCRSKTSGPSRRVKFLPVVLSMKVSLSGGDWQSIFTMFLCHESFDFERDYLLMRPSPDYQCGLKVVPFHDEALLEGRRLYSELSRPQREKGQWTSGSDLLLPAEAFCFLFSPQRARNVAKLGSGQWHCQRST